MRKNVVRIFVGLSFIAVAVVLLLVGLDVINSFDGWWTLLMIIPGIAFLISHGPNFGNMLLICLGGYFLITAQGWIDGKAQYFIPAIIIILLAFQIIFGGRRKIKWKNKWDKNQQNHYVSNGGTSGDCSAVFSMKSSRIDNKDYRGGEISSVFSSFDIDMSEMDMKCAAGVEVSAVFGSVNLKLPPQIKVSIKDSSVFGSTNNMIKVQNNDPAAPILYIESSAVFGTINIE